MKWPIRCKSWSHLFCSSPRTFCPRPTGLPIIPLCELSHAPLACARVNSRWLTGWSELKNTRFLDFGQVNLIGFARFFTIFYTFFDYIYGRYNLCYNLPLKIHLKTFSFSHTISHSHSPPHSLPLWISFFSFFFPSLFWCKKIKRPILGIKRWLVSSFLGKKRSKLGKTKCVDLVLPQEGWFSCGLDLVLPQECWFSCRFLLVLPPEARFSGIFFLVLPP